MAKKKLGRPPFKIDKEVLKKAESLASRGLTEAQVSQALGIDQTTLIKYKHINSNFSKAIKDGQAKGLAEIANALFVNAKEGNTSAQIFYMKNRGNWSDKQDITMDANITVIDPFED